MENQKELFEQFMHNNMPQEPFDPDKILAAAHDTQPDYQPSEKYLNGMNRLLRQSRRKARVDGVKSFFVKRWVPQAAVSFSVIICALFVAQANNGAIFDLLFQTHQTYTGIQLADQVRTELLADQLKDVDMQVYFPNYLPEGYAISDIEASAQKVAFELKNGDDYIWIVQKPLNGYEGKIGLDSEDAPLEEVTINGQKAFYNLKDGIHSLYFFDNNNFHKIKATAFSKKELVRIAESFEMMV